MFTKVTETISVKADKKEKKKIVELPAFFATSKR